MTEITVRTKEELKKAKKAKIKRIIVVGSLADNLKKAKKITTIGAVSLGVLTAAIGVGAVAAPVTGGISLGVSALSMTAISASTGVGVSTIIAASSIGIGLIVALFKDYKEIKVDINGMVFELKKG